MTYRELQKELAIHKQNGLTNIKLNSTKAILEAELDRIQCLEEIENNIIDIDDSEAVENFFTDAKQTISKLQIKYSDQETQTKNLDQCGDLTETIGSIFPRTPGQGLIHRTIHLVVCTYILLMYYLGLHIPDRKTVGKFSILVNKKVDTQSSISYESIFPTTPKNNLIARIIHLGTCTGILIDHLLFPRVLIPVICMAGSFSR